MLTASASLAQLRRFLVLASELHFSRAAERLGISQPFLSEQIRELEAGLGIQLFERTSRRVTLTPPGALLKSSLARSLLDMEGAVEAAVELQHGRSALRLGYSDEFTVGLLPRMVAALRRAHPAARFEFHTGNNRALRAALVDGAVDVVLICPVFEEPHEEGWMVVALPSTDLRVGLPAGHRLAGRASVALGELAGEDFLRGALPAEWDLERLVDRLFAQQGLTRNAQLRTGDGDLLRAFAASGLGLLIGAAEDFERIPQVTAVPLDPPVPVSRGAIFRQAPHTALLRDCWNYLRGLAGTRHGVAA